MNPKTKTMDYPSNGTIDDLTNTFIGDEDFFRAKLIKLERVHNAEGDTAIRATYQRVPPDEEYVSKDLFLFDITDASADDIKDITEEQLAASHALAFPDADKAEVYLAGAEAIIAIFREQ